MAAAPVLATHATGGRIAPRHLGVRTRAAPSPLVAPRSSSPLSVVPWAHTASAGGFALDLSIEAAQDRACVSVAVHNARSEPLWLGAVVVGFDWLAPVSGALRFLRNGWQSASETGPLPLDAAPAAGGSAWLRGMHHAVADPPADRSGWHESHQVGVVGAPGSGPCALLGAYESGRSFAVVYARRADAGAQLELELRVDALLAPGERRVLETAEIAVGVDVSALLEGFGSRWGRAADARVWWPFAAGWCIGLEAQRDVAEADVLRTLDALVAARDEGPIEIVQLDDGFQRSVGDWLETNAKLPRGLAALAADVRAAGFVPGLWTAPFCAVAESELFRKHPDWFLRDGGDPRTALLHGGWSADGRVFVLDTTRAEPLRHLEDLFRTLVGWGFFHLTLDFLFVAARGAPADPGVGAAERVRRGLAAVRRGAGDEAFLLACGCPLGPAVGLVDGMRVGPDVAPRWDPNPVAAVTGIPGKAETRNSLRCVLGRAWMHRRLWLNDPDHLLEGPRDERHARAVAIAATGGMVVGSGNLAALTPQDRALWRDTLTHARSVDACGIPGAARVQNPLEWDAPLRVVLDEPEAATVGLLNTGEKTTRAPLPPELEGAALLLGGPVQGGRLELSPHVGALWRREHPVAVAVFCDFDGTFSVQDVGSTLAARFAAERRPIQWARYERGEITPWEYNLEILDGLPVGTETLDAFLSTVELDPGARALLAWCDAQQVPFRILSDGFDWNLNRLQNLHDVRFRYDANRLRVEHGRWRIRAGAPDASCGCGTGTCKGGILRAYRARRPGAHLVHIGNGRVSDTCGALAADTVFAKDSLAEWLELRGIPYVEFETLHDVIPHLAGLQ